MNLTFLQRYDAGGAITPVDGEILWSRRGGIDAEVCTEGLDMCALTDLHELTGLDATLVGCGIGVDIGGLGIPHVILIDAMQAFSFCLVSGIGIKPRLLYRYTVHYLQGACCSRTEDIGCIGSKIQRCG